MVVPYKINSVLSGNESLVQGGAVSNFGIINITNSTFINNQTTDDPSFGGAIFNLGTTNITNSTFSDNTSGAGGAIRSESGTINIINSTFSGNEAIRGAAINVAGGGAVANIINSTITQNTSINDTVFLAFGTINVNNTIIGNQLSGADCSGVLTDNDFNLDSDDSCGFPNSETDMDLCPLANYGGLTDTHLPRHTSPALNAGDTTLDIDQRGFPRPGVGEGPNDDIGSVERQSSDGTCP
jgi:hypothetical protein